MNAGSVSRPRCRATLKICCSAWLACLGLPENSRSKPSSALAMPQPAFSSPTRLARGTRTWSKNTSQNSSWPDSVRIGRRLMPGLARSTSRKLMPACFLTVLSVRTSMNMWVASCANVDQVFWPVTIRSLPSITASQRKAARSDPASGSE
ncbi:hypothetical protein D3C72_1649820 [compost metagenome]